MKSWIRENWIPALVVFVAALIAFGAMRSRAEALGRAASEAEQGGRLTETVRGQNAEIRALTVGLAMRDAEHAEARREDAATFARLRAARAASERETDRLRSAIALSTAEADSILRVLRVKLRPEDLPAVLALVRTFRLEIGYLKRLNVGLTDQLAAADATIGLRDAEIVRVTEGRVEADSLNVSLRGAILTLSSRDSTRVREIGALRDAAGVRSFFPRVFGVLKWIGAGTLLGMAVSR